LHRLQLGFVVALKRSHAWWRPSDEVGSLLDVAAGSPWHGPEQPGAWQRVVRRFRDGHEEVWWALDVIARPYGPDKSRRAVVVTTDPQHVPALTTWNLLTNLPAPGSERAATSPFAAASVAEIVRVYGLRMWVEQSYKQVKHALGWAEYHVRSDLAIRRHWVLVWCAFSFCWWHLSHGTGEEPDGMGEAGAAACDEHDLGEDAGWGENQQVLGTRRPTVCWPSALRKVRGWLEPWLMLGRYWRAWSPLPPPPELQALLTWVQRGLPIYLYEPL
jgi:hypothetical protein